MPVGDEQHIALEDTSICLVSALASGSCLVKAHAGHLKASGGCVRFGRMGAISRERAEDVVGFPQHV